MLRPEKEERDWVRIFDTTLRDGEQSPGCTMNVEEKVRVAEQLELLGVDVIEAGFAAVSPGDFESVERVAEVVRSPVVLSLSRTRESDIKKALRAVEKAVKPGIHIFIATSELHMKEKLGMSSQEVIDAAVWSVRYAQKYIDHIEFSAEDASRSDFDFLCQIFREVIAVGATVCNVPDTTGYALPEVTRKLFGYLRENVSGSEGVVWSAHCHNDLGLAVANSLAAVEGGARQVECTVNGIGERAGNTALEEVVMALETHRKHFRVATRVNTHQIYPTSQKLSGVVGVPIAPTKPVVGANAFSHEAGIHQDGVLKNVLTYEIMKPSDVGRSKNNIVLGKHSGHTGLINRLKELGVDLSRVDVNDLFERFKALCDKKKKIYDEDLFLLLAGDGDAVQRFELLSATAVSSLSTIPTASVVLRIGDKEERGASQGDGAVEACYQAIMNLARVQFVLVGYQVHGVTEGTDAIGHVSCLVRADGIEVRGRGDDTDVIMASALAFVDALNRHEVMKARQMNGLGGPKEPQP